MRRVSLPTHLGHTMRRRTPVDSVSNSENVACLLLFFMLVPAGLGGKVPESGISENVRIVEKCAGMLRSVRFLLV